MLREFLSNLANKFREILGTTDKINAQDFADKVEEVFDAGYNSAVKEGTITILENTKELKIEGLPKAPKTLNLIAYNANTPPNDDIQWIRGLDYIADGFSFGTSTVKILACTWLATTRNYIGNGGSSNGSISERNNNQLNLITFNDGTFTIKVREDSTQYYGENFTYKWIATF